MRNIFIIDAWVASKQASKQRRAKSELSTSKKPVVRRCLLSLAENCDEPLILTFEHISGFLGPSLESARLNVGFSTAGCHGAAIVQSSIKY